MTTSYTLNNQILINLCSRFETRHQLKSLKTHLPLHTDVYLYHEVFRAIARSRIPHNIGRQMCEALIARRDGQLNDRFEEISQ